MGLRDKYAYAIQAAKNVRMQGSADERDGKLYFHGTVNTQDEANQIWNGILATRARIWKSSRRTPINCATRTRSNRDRYLNFRKRRTIRDVRAVHTW